MQPANDRVSHAVNRNSRRRVLELNRISHVSSERTNFMRSARSVEVRKSHANSGIFLTKPPSPPPKYNFSQCLGIVRISNEQINRLILNLTSFDFKYTNFLQVTINTKVCKREVICLAGKRNLRKYVKEKGKKKRNSVRRKKMN